MKLRTLLKPFAMLPLGALYAFSSCVIYPALRLIRYRRDVIRENLAKCFPELDEKERLRIERRFYRNFSDSFVETLKLLHISDKEIERRVEWQNLDVLRSELAAGRSVAIYFSHCFNWEWAPSVTLHLNEPGVEFCQIYRPLDSERFDELMLDVRSRFGSQSLPKDVALRRLIGMRREGLKTVTGFMSDQHPGHGDPGLVTTLLGQPTRMITGTETLARKMGMAVAYWDIERLRRGHFRIATVLIASDPASLPEGEITERYTRLLEKTIRREPSNWLWSHNRWKHPV